MIIFLIGEIFLMAGFYLSRKKTDKWIFTKLARQLYEKVTTCEKKGKGKRRISRYHSASLEQQMRSLYPDRRVEDQIREFQIRKIALVLMAIFIGNVFMILVCLCSRTDAELINGAQIIRNNWGAGKKQVSVRAETGEQAENILLEVEERHFSREEADQLEREAASILGHLILGANENLYRITTDLNLVKGVDGYPFVIYWESSDYSYVKSNGQVENEKLQEKGKDISLRAVLTYENQKWVEQFQIRLYEPVLTKNEEWRKLLLSQIEAAQEKSLTEQMLVLPSRVQEKIITWKENKSSLIFQCMGAFLLIVVLLLFLPNQKLQQKSKERKEELLLEYPDFISKLTLYLGAGLTLQRAWRRMTDSYLKEKKQTGQMNYLYEEMLITSYEYDNGIAETQIYEAFGRRCAEMPYRKCCALLTGNLKSGNEKLLLLMKQEAEEALLYRKQTALRLGEEAETRLLLPMIMMLILVMLLIMIPAYFAIN